MEKSSIIEYLIKRINELGVSEFFGVPGDYNFNIIEEIEANPNTNWVGNCNELNAGYAADGYARIKGMGAIVTTFGVGELSAINAIAGSFAESVPVVKLVGLPKKKFADDGYILHHCLGRADYEVFCEMYSKVTAHSVIITKENAQKEIDTALSIAYNEKKPVYIGLYDDICLQTIDITPTKIELKKSDKETLDQAIEHICQVLDESKNPLIISEYPIIRYGLEEQMQNLIEKSGFMASTLSMGKSSIDENSPNYVGLYCGTLICNKITEVIENADCILGFGILMTDFNSGGHTSKLDFERVIDIEHDCVTVKDTEYKNIYIYDVLEKLNEKITPKKIDIPDTKFGYEKMEATEELLTQQYIFSALQDFLSPNDTYVTETGLTSFGSVPLKLPSGIKCCSQLLWGSIGWGTPACLGVCLADKTKRVVMITGEGSHQMTAQEVSNMLRFGVNPIIIVVNNEGYTIERLLCKDPMDAYNDIAKWDYTKFVESFDGDALTIKAKTKKDFADALNDARRSNKLVYIEAFTGIMDAPDFALNLTKKVSPLEGQLT